MQKHCIGGFMNHDHPHQHVPPPPCHYPYDTGVQCIDHHHPCPPPHPPLKPYPDHGKMVENGFMLVNTSPFLYDNNNVTYGQRVIVSENVNTIVYQRKDPCCLNLAATFDMTEDIVTNTVLQHYLKEFISKNAKTLNGVLPIIRHYIKFTLTYTISDVNGGIVQHDHKTVICDQMQYHATDVDDYFVSSCKGHIHLLIPPISYPGVYTFTLNNISASVDVLNTIEHITENFNPYYQFTDNNTKIAVQHDVIMEDKSSDMEVLIASADINKSFIFKSNMINKACVSFTSYLSSLISMFNTFDLWESFEGELDDGAVKDLNDKINELTKTIDHMSDTIEELQRLNDKLQDEKVDKEEGKGLSSNDYTDEDKQLLHTLVNKGQIVFDTKDNFPNPGVSGILYVANDMCLTYIWDDTRENYVCLNNVDVEQIKPVIEDEVQTSIENSETIVDLTDRVENLESQAIGWAYLGDK